MRFFLLAALACLSWGCHPERPPGEIVPVDGGPPLKPPPPPPPDVGPPSCGQVPQTLLYTGNAKIALGAEAIYLLSEDGLFRSLYGSGALEVLLASPSDPPAGKLLVDSTGPEELLWFALDGALNGWNTKDLAPQSIFPSFDAEPKSLAQDAEYVYGLRGSSAYAPSLLRTSKATGVVQEIAVTVGWPWAAAVADGVLFASDKNQDSRLLRVPLDWSEMPSVLSETAIAPEDVVPYGDWIYFVDYTGGVVLRVPKEGGETEVLGYVDNARSLWVDEQGVFVGGAPAATVYRLPHDGGLADCVASLEGTLVSSIAASSTSLWVATSAYVAKLEKPVGSGMPSSAPAFVPDPPAPPPECEPPDPDFLPVDFTPLTDLGCACDYWVAPPDVLLSGVWGACAGSPPHPCEALSFPVFGDPTNTVQLVHDTGGRGLGGEALLGFVRFSDSPTAFTDQVVVDGTGAVRSFLRAPRTYGDPCTLGGVWTNEGVMVHAAVDGGTARVLVDRLDGTLPVLAPQTHSSTVRIWPGAERFVRSGFSSYGPTFVPEPSFVLPGKDAQSIESVSLVGRAGIVQVSDLTGVGRIYGFDDDGVSLLVPGIPPFEARHAGTDGSVIVWTEGSWIRSSPFTVDLGSLQPTSVALDPDESDLEHAWAVGCGHAARALPGDVVALVRLSDGALATLGDATVPMTQALAIDCAHVFTGDGTTIFRVPLSVIS